MDEQRNPDIYEQLYLLNIESQNKMSISDIENFYTRMKQHIATYKDLLSIIDLLNIYEAYFLSYTPIVQRLDKIGKHQLSKRLDEILSDLREAIQIFQQMNKNIINIDNDIKQDTIIMTKGV